MEGQSVDFATRLAFIGFYIVVNRQRPGRCTSSFLSMREEEFKGRVLCSVFGVVC